MIYHVAHHVSADRLAIGPMNSTSTSSNQKQHVTVFHRNYTNQRHHRAIRYHNRENITASFRLVTLVIRLFSNRSLRCQLPQVRALSDRLMSALAKNHPATHFMQSLLTRPDGNAVDETRYLIGKTENLSYQMDDVLFAQVRLNAVSELPDLKAEWHFPMTMQPNRKRVLLYAHGGAYALLSPVSYRRLASNLAHFLGHPVLVVDYRLAPENPYPAALIDIIHAIRYLVDVRGYELSDIALGGDSAGGGLSVAATMLMRDLGWRPIAGVYAISPWLDLTCQLPSWRRNARDDYLGHPADFVEIEDDLEKPLSADPKDWTDLKALGREYGLMYASKTVTLTNGRVSPLFAQDFSNLPPFFVQAGGSETLLDECVRLVHRFDRVEKCDAKTRPITLTIYPRMVHVFQLFDQLEPRATHALQDAATWLRDLWDEKEGSELVEN